MKSRSFLTIALLTAFLAACSQTTDVSFRSNQSWRLETKIRYDESLIDLVGEGIGIAISNELDVPLLQPAIGARADWCRSPQRLLWQCACAADAAPCVGRGPREAIGSVQVVVERWSDESS
jgi:hypothetical protein